MERNRCFQGLERPVERIKALFEMILRLSFQRRGVCVKHVERNDGQIGRGKHQEDVE